jgi:Fe-S cluster biogenesis protein NfuA
MITLNRNGFFRVILRLLYWALYSGTKNRPGLFINAHQQVIRIMKDYLPKTDPLYDKVISALETVRPYLQVDGGDCQLVGITKDMVVDVKLLGACGSCPMSTLTLRAGVEQAIKKAIPEIARVESV